jgi:hypothetical protein
VQQRWYSQYPCPTHPLHGLFTPTDITSHLLPAPDQTGTIISLSDRMWHSTNRICVSSYDTVNPVQKVYFPRGDHILARILVCILWSARGEKRCQFVQGCYQIHDTCTYKCFCGIFSPALDSQRINTDSGLLGDANNPGKPHRWCGHYEATRQNLIGRES